MTLLLFQPVALRMLIPAVDAHTGEPVVFDRQSGVDLVDADVVRTINQVQGEQKTVDFGAVLLTRFKPSDAIHQKISSWIRSFLSDTNPPDKPVTDAAEAVMEVAD